ncbi:hypothetical protein HDF16_003381 [Granulicella aggregans]|uniref:Uncharacterized protein n=1 Tax=Granulicella aggregans TaxID=474949 RepID=A0A7W8E4I1_9BACT|nr:hypothetical protein [Granulicella aggregans]MBB5058667.1 hypothetical protein [Granulicella aggregans]
MAEFRHAILFTGHMIDAPGRVKERFPARAEDAGRRAITKSVENLLTAIGQESVVGIAGGASGGDILFHDVCESFKVPTLLRLALQVEKYLETSVAPAGGDWVERFHMLLARLGPGAIAVLDDSVELPESLTEGASLNIWQRTNLWMVDEAIQLAPQRTLLALWDGKAGDGPGGTEHLVQLAPSFDIDVAPIIRTQALVTPLA